MRYAFLVAWREYTENTRTKGFWIGIFLFPLILFLSIQVPVLLQKKGTPSRHFVVVDQSGQFEQTVEDALEQQHQWRVVQALADYTRQHALPAGEGARALTNAPGGVPLPELSREMIDGFIRHGGQEVYLRELRPRLKPDAPPFSPPRRQFQRVALPQPMATNTELSALAQELKPYLRGEKKIEAGGRKTALFAAILIPADVAERIQRPGASSAPAAPGASRAPATPAGIEYWSANLADSGLRDELQRAINEEVRRREYLARGIDVGVLQQVAATRVPFASLNPRKEAGKERVSRADVLRQWAPVAFVYLLWIAIFSISQMLLNNVIEEKSNRIIEVLLSSVTPGELMMGKLAGIAAVGLTMVGAWLAALVGILAWTSSAQSELATQMYSVIRTSNLLPAFIFYFIFGYLIYAAFILAIGSVCNTIKEAQNYMGVITMIMMVPLFTMMFIPKDPNGMVATVLSWIPFYTPFIMMNRAAADPPLFDLIGTMVLLVVCTGLMLWISVKIFRIGVLRTGQPPKLLELLRWIRG